LQHKGIITRKLFFQSFYLIQFLDLCSKKNKSKNLHINELYNETTSDSSAMQILNQWRSTKDYDITSAQELKIINLILESIKVKQQ